MKYQIQHIEKLTGIKTPTIRIWEKRYRVANPERSKTNIRYYNEADLQKFLMLASLTRKGFLISELSKLTFEELKQKLLIVYTQPFENDAQTSLLTENILTLDTNQFQYNFLKIALQNSRLHLFEKIILPLLNYINSLWISGEKNLAFANFAFNLISKTVVSNFAGNYNAEKNENCIVFSLSRFYNSLIEDLVELYMLDKNNVYNIQTCDCLQEISFFAEKKKLDKIVLVAAPSDINNEISETLFKLKSEHQHTQVAILDYFDIFSQNKNSENNFTIAKSLSEL